MFRVEVTDRVDRHWIVLATSTCQILLMTEKLELGERILDKNKKKSKMKTKKPR